MKLTQLILLLTAMIFATLPTTAQQEQPSTKAGSALTQNVRGIVTDAESKQPLAGVIVVVKGNNEINTTTDAEGRFVLQAVPVGRQSFQFNLLGFETYNASEVQVITGKELELNVSLRESLTQLSEVVVSAGKDRARPNNEFAAISARSFSVEETRRYAASFADPARMAQNFPGVSNSGDMDNSIVVRGNSPKGVLWRLEGIEIPNPNHFSGLGATGGAVSMLNANVLASSDFYTGAFPADVGNALAGAFDLNFRNGNTERREHTVQVGALGVELATEGPFKKGGKSSYLVNYRYSTLALLGGFFDFGTMVPDYQDAAIKLNFPTDKAGTFSFFGMGGYNTASRKAVADSSAWNDEEPNNGFSNKNMMGVAGISHQYFLTKNSYLRTVVSASYDKGIEDADTLNPAKDYAKVPIVNTSSSNTALRATMMYNQKLDARNTFRAGVIAQQMSYSMDYNFYDDNEQQWKNFLTGDGSTQFYQAYVQWKKRLDERLTMIGGVHGSYLALNGKYSIEPRISATYEVRRQKFTLAAGLHSKPEHISTFLFQNKAKGAETLYPNKNLDLQRALHIVGGYETRLPWDMRLKAEVYYQHLYSVPVEMDSTSGFSMINAENIYSLMNTKQGMASEGTGNNYGIDLSIERPFANNYYLLASGSIYKSTYKDYLGREFNTRFNRGYQVNLIGGKEFKVSASGRKVLGLNGKVLHSGGLRESEIDIARSMASEKTEIVPGSNFTRKGKPYFRADLGVYYKVNRARATHSIHFEAQNVTNNKNYYFSYFDATTGKVKEVNQLGFFPNISYRLDFHY